MQDLLVGCDTGVRTRNFRRALVVSAGHRKIASLAPRGEARHAKAHGWILRPVGPLFALCSLLLCKSPPEFARPATFFLCGCKKEGKESTSKQLKSAEFLPDFHGLGSALMSAKAPAHL
jgi:hypothetical protein